MNRKREVNIKNVGSRISLDWNWIGLECSQRWLWCDDWWQTVPDSCCCAWKCTITNGLSSSPRDNQCVGWCWSVSAQRHARHTLKNSVLWLLLLFLLARFNCFSFSSSSEFESIHAMADVVRKLSAVWASSFDWKAIAGGGSSPWSKFDKTILVEIGLNWTKFLIYEVLLTLIYSY